MIYCGNSLLFLFGRPVSEHKLLWQPSDCIINFVLLTLLLHVGNKYDDDDLAVCVRLRVCFHIESQLNEIYDVEFTDKRYNSYKL